MRYVRRDRRIYDFSLCKRCGTAGGCGSNGCEESTCLLCGTTQCSSNGLGNGCCKVCYHGYLPNWSRRDSERVCRYKGCGKAAVGSFPLKGPCCREHGLTILNRKWPGYLDRAMTDRERTWELVA